MDRNSKKLKILMVSNQGGYSHIQTHIYYVARILKNKNFHLTILAPHAGNWTRKMQKSGYHVDIKNFNNKSLKTFFQMYKYFKENKFDIIHSHSTNLYWAIAAKLAKSDTKLIHTFHTGLEIHIDSFFEKLGLKKFDKIITININQQKMLIPFQIQADKIEHISYGISERFYVNNMPYDKTKIRKKFGLKENIFTIGTLGRFEEKNGFEYLLDALVYLKDNMRFNCVVVGDGNGKDDFLSKVKEKGLERFITLTGYCDHIYDLLPAFDVLVLPYITEEYSIIPLEAMASGIPVIAFKQRYLVELVDEFESVIVVPNKDAKALAHNINYLYQNRNYLEDIALSGYLKAQNYHQELMMNKLLDLYQKD